LMNYDYKNMKKKFFVIEWFCIIFLSSLFLSNLIKAEDKFEESYENMKNSGMKVERLDNDRFKSQGMYFSRIKPMKLNLPTAVIKQIKVYDDIENVDSATFLNENRILYGTRTGSWSGGVVDLKNGTVAELISPIAKKYDANAVNLLGCFMNSHIFIQVYGKRIYEKHITIKCDISPNAVFYDLNNIIKIRKNNNDEFCIKGNERLITNSEFLNEKHYKGWNIINLVADASAKVNQGQNDIILYDGDSRKLTKCDASSNSCVIYSLEDSKLLMDDFFQHNLGGETYAGHSITMKSNGCKNAGIQGVYDVDEKGKESKIFDYGSMAFWSPDEKARFVITESDENDSYRKKIVLLMGHGEKAVLIPFDAYKVTILALSI